MKMPASQPPAPERPSKTIDQLFQVCFSKGKIGKPRQECLKKCRGTRGSGPRAPPASTLPKCFPYRFTFFMKSA